MLIPRLKYPVETLDGATILPAGAVLSEEKLIELASSGRTGPVSLTPLMEFGTVRQDLLGFSGEGAYRIIFDDPKQGAGLLAHMDKVRLARPLLEGLAYFRRHEPYTYRHILMVFALTTLLARDLLGNALDGFLVDGAGPMHDFGKICVPLQVMKKSTPLRRHERALLEHHTLAGYALLGYYLKDPKALAARVALEHHERRDRSGYPLGTRLSDPLVEIVVVCDVYDALISQRPYRKISFDNRTALEEITAMAECGKVGWEIVQALVARNRTDKPRARECAVSVEKRGTPPEGNLYGIILEDGSPVGVE